MGAIEVECPECRRRLRLSDDHRGKSVRCPACRCIFGIRNILPAAGTDPPPPPPNRLRPRSGANTPLRRPPVASQSRADDRPARRSKPRRTETQDPWETLPDEDVFGGGLSSYGDAELADSRDGSDETPRRRRRTRSRLDLTKVMLFLLMGVIGLGAVGGVGYAIWQFLPRGGFSVFGNTVDLTYMPTNIEAFIHVEVSRVLNAPAIQTLLKASPAVRTALTGAATGTDFRPEDIESLTFGIWKKSGQSRLTGATGNMRFPVGADDSEFLLVLRTIRPLDETSFGMGRASEHNGVSYSSSGDFAVWLPDARTAVIGPSAYVTAAIDQGSTQHRFPQFDFVDSGYDILVAGTGTATSANSVPAPTQALRDLQTSLQQSAQGVALGIDVSSGIDANVQVLCRDSAQAAALSSEMKTSIAAGKSEVNQRRSDPMLSAFMTDIESVMNSLSVTQSGETVRLQVRIEQATIDRVAAIAALAR